RAAQARWSVMTDHLSAVELVGLPGMPNVARGVRLLAQRHRWQRRKRPGRGGEWEYAITSLPSATQAAILLQRSPPASAGAGLPPANDDAATRRDSLWSAFAAKPAGLRAMAAHRLKVLDAVEALIAAGQGRQAAMAAVAAESGEDVRTIRRWFGL